jgi:glutathione reductase (NADPH)
VKHIEKLTEAVQVHLEGSTHEIISADAILAATGRAPNIANLGLEMLQLDRVHSDSEDDSVNTIWVNEFSQTSQPHIFAVGDVTNRMNLTPVAIGEGRAFADTEFGQQKRSLSHDNIPTAIFTTPEAATVGLSESAARKKYGADTIRTYMTSFRPMYHSLAGRPTKTFMKLVVELSSDKVLGAHMVGDHAAEIIQGLAISVKLGARKSDFDATVGIHPTVAEEFVTMR